MDLIDKVNEKHANPRARDIPDFRSGDTVAVHARIREGDKVRVQVFQGTCIAIKAKGRMNGHFRVRKASGGTGVERTFPFHSPAVERVEVLRRGKARRSKLYYLRERSGRGARIAIDHERGPS